MKQYPILVAFELKKRNGCQGFNHRVHVMTSSYFLKDLRAACAEVIRVLLSSCSAPAKLVNATDADEVGVARALGWGLMIFKKLMKTD